MIDIDYIKKTPLLTIKYDANEQHYCFLLNPITSYIEQGEEHVFCYIKTILAKFGESPATALLLTIKDIIPTTLYIHIGSYISQSIGDYKKQLDYLNITKPFTYAWIEREKIRCLINQCEIKGAMELVNEFNVKIKNEHTDFITSVFWQLNCWDELEELCVKVNNIHGEKIASYNKGLISTKNTQNCKIYSLYNIHTIEQVKLQCEVMNKSNLKITPSLGIPADRLTKGAVKNLGGGVQLGILGAAISHLKILEEIVEGKDDFAIVTESDSYLEKMIDFNLLDELFKKEKYDFILCANRHFAGNKSNFNIDDVIKYEFYKSASGFDGFIISKKCAQLVLEAFDGKIHNQHIDGQIIRWLCDNKFNVGVTPHPIFCQAFSSIFSTRVKIELQ